MDGLFSGTDLSRFLSKRERDMYAEIDAVSERRMLSTSPEAWCDYFFEKYRVEPLQIDELSIQVDYGDARVDVSHRFEYAVSDRSRPAYVTGTRVTFHIPFNGDSVLFSCRPSQFRLSRVRGVVRGNEIQLVYARSHHDAQALQQEFQQDIENLHSYIGWSERDVRAFNESIREKASRRIDGRRDKLLQDRQIVERLGFPIKQRNDPPRTYTTPQVRRRLNLPEQPAMSEPPKVPEPAIAMGDYEHILSVILSMVDVIERSPRAFTHMCEQDLRQHFLVQLNGQYQGIVTGETFNYDGKTDILIRIDNRAVFIAECKFWRGSVALIAAIDQLLGYTSWRDTKTAILVFNRDTNMTTVLERIPAVVRQHENYKREARFDSELGFRYVFGHKQDPARELILTVLVFDTPGPRTPRNA